LLHVTGGTDRDANRPLLAPAVTLGRLAFLPSIAGSALGLATLVLPPHPALFIIAAVALCWAVWVTLSRGDRYLTPSGLFAISAGIFLGAGSLYLGILGSETWDLGEIRDLAVVTLVTTLLTDAVIIGFSLAYRTAWPTQEWTRRAKEERTTTGAFKPPTHFELKALLLIAGSKVPMIESLGPTISPAMGLVGVLMISLGFSSLRQRIRWAGDAIIAFVAVVVPAVWIATVFKGYGRLTLAGLAFAVLAAWNLVRPARFQKLALVLALPGMLLVMGEARRNMDNDDPRRVHTEATTGAGLESVYNPLETLAIVVNHHPVDDEKPVGPRYGATFVNTLLLPIPRSWWEHKPKGFGAELTESLRPNIANTGHSMAALAPGEWYANFGWFGFGLMPLVLGWVLARWDRWHARLAAAPFSHPADWYSAVTLLCIMSSIGEIYWVGTFTFFSRGGLAAVFAWALTRLSIRRVAVRPSTAPYRHVPPLAAGSRT
jgi:hypothetical protein